MTSNSTNGNTTKLISPERVEALFDSYGANPDAWPDDERATALVLIQNSSELQDLQRQAEQLDQFLMIGDNRSQSNEPVDSKLVARIVDHLPEQDKSTRVDATSIRKRSRRPLFDISEWLGNKWIGMAAASIAVLLISVSIMNLHTVSVPNEQPSLAQVELDEWMWEQVTGEANSEDDEPITFMTLL